eukprot:g19906.t1
MARSRRPPEIVGVLFGLWVFQFISARTFISPRLQPARPLLRPAGGSRGTGPAATVPERSASVAVIPILALTLALAPSARPPRRLTGQSRSRCVLQAATAAAVDRQDCLRRLRGSTQRAAVHEVRRAETTGSPAAAPLRRPPLGTCPECDTPSARQHNSCFGYEQSKNQDSAGNPLLQHAPTVQGSRDEDQPGMFLFSWKLRRP